MLWVKAKGFWVDMKRWSVESTRNSGRPTEAVGTPLFSNLLTKNCGPKLKLKELPYCTNVYKRKRQIRFLCVRTEINLRFFLKLYYKKISKIAL